MKKYKEFLLEDVNQSETGNTVQNSDITFDVNKYNDILNNVKTLWFNVFTERNLNFDKDDVNNLKKKLQNQRYKNYWKKIKAELARRQQSDVEQENKDKINQQQELIKKIMSSGFDNKQATAISNLIPDNPGKIVEYLDALNGLKSLYTWNSIISTLQEMNNSGKKISSFQPSSLMREAIRTGKLISISPVKTKKRVKV